jgi:Peptidase S24-like
MADCKHIVCFIKGVMSVNFLFMKKNKETTPDIETRESEKEKEEKDALINIFNNEDAHISMKRLSLVLIYKGIRKSDFEKMIEITSSNWTNWVKRGIACKKSIVISECLSTQTDIISIDWLLTGKKLFAPHWLWKMKGLVNKEDRKLIPILEGGMQKCEPVLFNTILIVTTQDDLLSIFNSTNENKELRTMPFEAIEKYSDKSLFCIEIKDDFIIKEAGPGYRLIFARDLDLENGDIVYAKNNSAYAIMRYVTKLSGEFLEDLGRNEHYPPIKAEDAHIIGVEIAKYKVEYKKR